MNTTKLNEITDRLQGRSFLLPVETSVLNIPERLEEYDPNMFICFNSKTQGYEVHSLRNREGNTYALNIPWPELDSRVLKLVSRRDQNRRPLKEIIQEIDEHNETLERQKQATRDNELSGMARETANHLFKKHHAMGV